ncbi:MAG: hypothetical protein WC570_00835 [Patescibacteria group bacterium]
MDRKILFIVGLPGSGKTSIVNELSSQGYSVFDDYKAGAVNDDSAFNMSQHYSSLMKQLEEGKDCAILDIDFCREEARQEAVTNIQNAFNNEIEVDWIFFENEPYICVENVVNRHIESNKDQTGAIMNIGKYSPLYTIPNQYEDKIKEVYRGKVQHCDR